MRGIELWNTDLELTEQRGTPPVVKEVALEAVYTEGAITVGPADRITPSNLYEVEVQVVAEAAQVANCDERLTERRLALSCFVSSHPLENITSMCTFLPF